jgi:two-component system, NtrC family, response regulator HydG
VYVEAVHGDETSTGPGWLAKPSSERSAGGGPALMIAWSASEPSRVGECALVPSDGRACSIGRGEAAAGEPERLGFSRVRPGYHVDTGRLAGRESSRRQLALRLENGRIVVERVGPALRLNGIGVERASLEPGDRLTVERQLVLLCVERALGGDPKDTATFAFGSADPFGMVGESTAAWALRQQVAFCANRDEHVLLVGPSGAGKELVARALHALSARRNAPFVARNAATLPPGIIDAELFGNARNYPNAGMRERSGLVGEADGGTLLLDEVGELPEELQSHLLRLLDRGEYHRLGDDRPRAADLRLFGATNRPEAALKHDLAARFKLRIRVLGLDERREDVPLIARSLLRGHAQRDPSLAQRFFQLGEPRIDPELMEALLDHDYTTHVRELDRLLISAMATSRQGFIALTPEVAAELTQKRRKIPEREEIVAALARADGNVSEAWKLLGLSSRDALNRLMKKLGVEPARPRRG